MELIDELEPTRRGPYSGGIGGVSFTGQMDIALALRTMVFPTQRNDTMYSYKHANSRREWVVHLQVCSLHSTKYTIYCGMNICSGWGITVSYNNHVKGGCKLLYILQGSAA